MRKSNAEKQADWRRRQKAKWAAMEAALRAEQKCRAEVSPGAEVTAEVLASLDRIRHLLELQSARLATLERREHGSTILRHLVELRRAMGSTELHLAPRASRRRPLT